MILSAHPVALSEGSNVGRAAGRHEQRRGTYARGAESEGRPLPSPRANRACERPSNHTCSISSRVTVRGFRRRPAMALTVVATLSLCIGANTAIFSAVDTLLLKPLPYPAADRLVAIHETNWQRRETARARRAGSRGRVGERGADPGRHRGLLLREPDRHERPAAGARRSHARVAGVPDAVRHRAACSDGRSHRGGTARRAGGGHQRGVLGQAFRPRSGGRPSAAARRRAATRLSASCRRRSRRPMRPLRCGRRCRRSPSRAKRES